MSRIAIFGTGGFAVQMIDTVAALADQGHQIFFADDQVREFFGYPVTKLVDVGIAELVISVSEPDVRRSIASRYARHSPGTLRANTAIVSERAEIAGGAIIAHQVVIEAGAKVGAHFHANAFAFVAHDCSIGDFVTIGPRATCCGNVRIGDGVTVGAHAVIRNGTPTRPLIIGAGAVIGMGAVITKNVPAGAIVYGNPARIHAWVHAPTIPVRIHAGPPTP